jgi:hypothetical protein
MLYMFRAEPPPIISSSDCTYSVWYLSNLAATCCSFVGMERSSIPTMIATISSKVWQIPEAVSTVCAPDDGWRFCLKHVERYWNKEIEESDILLVVPKEYIWRCAVLWVSKKHFLFIAKWSCISVTFAKLLIAVVAQCNFVVEFRGEVCIKSCNQFTALCFSSAVIGRVGAQNLHSWWPLKWDRTE